MALTLTEGLIRNRVNLTHENLEDIKSLSLPGTYHEKIVSIGTSLRKFTRLKSLDFSRNALESLQGLEHLPLLEKLNLYYNNVSSLEELKRLTHNPNLREIDLRLNPVTRNEPDYRLYLIHMLPNLQKLDDRGVRDRERHAALTHFSTGQAIEMAPAPPKQLTPTKASLPRTEMVSKLMKGPSVLVDDDVAVIDMVNRQGGDLSKPRPLTGSAAKGDKVEDYSLDDIQQLLKELHSYTGGLKLLDQPKPVRHRDKTIGEAMAETPKRRRSPSPESQNAHVTRYKDLYPNIMSVPNENVQRIGEASRRDPNLLFPDEVEANSKYRGQGFFTPHPQAEIESVHSKPGRSDHYDPLNASDPFPKTDREEFIHTKLKARYSPLDLGPKVTQDDSAAFEKPRRHRTNSVPGREVSPVFQSDEAKEKTFIYSLLNLVDRYWNGSKSLHKHPKFIEQALKYLSEYVLTRENNKEEQIKKLKRKVETLEEENNALRMRKDNLSVDSSFTSEAELKAALKKAHEDIKRMHAEIRHYISENRALQKRLDGFNYSSNASLNRYNSAAAAADDLPNHEDLLRQNSALSQELEMMRAKLKQYNQLQELASMLQESHKSLVETNDHLLHELHETKEKHQQEIEQMHWSYEQLRSTMGYSSILRPSNHSFSNNNPETTQPSSISNYSREGAGV